MLADSSGAGGAPPPAFTYQTYGDGGAAAPSPSASQFEQLRSDAKSSESNFDKYASQMESITSSADGRISGAVLSSSDPSGNNTSSSSSSNSGSGTVRSVIANVELLFRNAKTAAENELRSLKAITAEMAVISNSCGGAGNTGMWTERFQGVVVEKEKILARLQLQFRVKIERIELTLPVGLSSHNHNHHNSNDPDDGAGLSALIDERNSISHSHQRVNHILESATDTQARLRRQRERLAHVDDSLAGLIARIPVIGGVLNRINSRRRREAVILGVVFAFCLIVTVIFW